MKTFAAFLFLILPAISFAQEATFAKDYELEKYTFGKKQPSQRANPDLKLFDGSDEFELLENKSRPAPTFSEQRKPENRKSLIVKVSIGVEVAEYEAVENTTQECSKTWPADVVGYFMEDFEKRNIQITPEQFTTSYCFNGVKYSIEE